MKLVFSISLCINLNVLLHSSYFGGLRIEQVIRLEGRVSCINKVTSSLCKYFTNTNVSSTHIRVVSIQRSILYMKNGSHNQYDFHCNSGRNSSGQILREFVCTTPNIARILGAKGWGITNDKLPRARVAWPPIYTYILWPIDSSDNWCELCFYGTIVFGKGSALLNTTTLLLCEKYPFIKLL